jgi:hypothetical protein
VDHKAEQDPHGDEQDQRRDDGFADRPAVLLLLLLRLVHLE